MPHSACALRDDRVLMRLQSHVSTPSHGCCKVSSLSDLQGLLYVPRPRRQLLGLQTRGPWLPSSGPSCAPLPVSHTPTELKAALARAPPASLRALPWLWPFLRPRASHPRPVAM